MNIRYPIYEGVYRILTNKEIKTFILLFSFTENHYLCSVFLPSLT